VTALLASIFICLIWPKAETRFALAGFMFLATASFLALLRPPRRTVFDRQRQEARVTIGWPPFGRRRMTAFSDVAEVRVWRLLDLGEFGHARPALVLQSGEIVFLSTYSRSPVACRETVLMLQDLLPRPAT
jgi:hypothetical protein